ncbi:hypothetical protein NLI96_g3508 [Meripilus lineatus]|uniref:Aquaporin n=1 Tax=Meripilus lineatus TaxID=2056292 RepID=A0AAD5V6R2_9APHY|nr:hypothetical protein NLI96_g3508 [Physisporinus lineatus]
MRPVKIASSAPLRAIHRISSEICTLQAIYRIVQEAAHSPLLPQAPFQLQSSENGRQLHNQLSSSPLLFPSSSLFHISQRFPVMSQFGEVTPTSTVRSHFPTKTLSVHVESSQAREIVVEPSHYHDDSDKYPNNWARYREMLKEPLAEFFGVMFIILFGAGVDCQVVLSGNPAVASSPKGDYLSISFGWAVGVALGAWISGGISGGHINPAVTLAFAFCRDFPWRKVPSYIFAQLMGGIVGAAIIYGNYHEAISVFEGGVKTVPGTAGLFTTFAFLGTAILLIVVCAITDKKNGPPPAGLVPLALFIAILGIGAAMGMQTGYAINPARDLGPRILTAMAGYGKEVFTFRNHYWFWCPVLAPILGAIAGVLAYDACFYTGEDSVFNRPSLRVTNVAHVCACSQPHTMPSPMQAEKARAYTIPEEVV